MVCEEGELPVCAQGKGKFKRLDQDGASPKSIFFCLDLGAPML